MINPWLVQAGRVLIAVTPMVARLVIITEYCLNNRAELFFKPNSDIFFPEPVMNIVFDLVKSLGVNQKISPFSQYRGSIVDGVPRPMFQMHR